VKTENIFRKSRRHVPSDIHYAGWRAKSKFIRERLETCPSVADKSGGRLQSTSR